MQLNEKEKMLNALLGIVTVGEKSLSWAELVQHAYNFGKQFKIPEESVERVILYFEETYGIKKPTAKIICDADWSDWLSDFFKNHKKEYFERYQRYLLSEKEMPPLVVESLGIDIERMCKHFANPYSEYVTSKKGLVVGDVQSGKTSNYIGLINMACDIGYKNFVLLTGTTESLRNQTQKRVDDGFIGAKSNSISKQIEYLGVGKNDEKYYAITLTDQNTDFLKRVADAIKINEDDVNKPRIFIIKKNKRVLDELSEYLSVGENTRSDSSLLILDDECDYASLNTKAGTNRTAINGLISKLFNLYKTTTYVGYTATPYANIFVDPNDEEDKQDLFPKDFIALLEPPTNYMGGTKVFESFKENLTLANSQHGPSLYGPHVYILNEGEKDFLPTIHTITEAPSGIPNSLKKAICSFLIANCIRTLKGDKTKHRSMLINISRFNDIQEDIKHFVDEYLTEMKNAIEQTYMLSDLNRFLNSEVTQMLYDVWVKYDVYHEKFGEDAEKGIPSNRERFAWIDIQHLLNDEIQMFETTIANYKHKNDRYDYDAKEDVGARVIVIGGFSLSRGLTLEGLMTSYYSRNASAYDVLLQMGRWFGYRPNYEELCMVFMSQINIDSFRAAIDATEELKQSFRDMEEAGKTPKNFGLMVKGSPDSLDTNLLVTAKNKCRSASFYRRIVNISGKVLDTSKIFKSKEINDNNESAVRILLNSASQLGKTFVVSESDSKYKYLKSVPVSLIISFLSQFKFPFANKKFDKDGIVSLLKSDVNPILRSWDIVFAKGRKNDGWSCDYTGEDSPVVYRSFISRKKENYLRIAGSNNRLADPNLFRIGLTEEQYDEVLNSDPGKTAHAAEDYLKFNRNPLLIIYPMRIGEDQNDNGSEDNGSLDTKEVAASFDNTNVIGIALGFPGNSSIEYGAEYLYNTVKISEIESENGGSDDIDDDYELMEEEMDD